MTSKEARPFHPEQSLPSLDTNDVDPLTFKGGIGNFVSGNEGLDASEQLALMKEFWRQTAYTMPELAMPDLDSEQLSRLSARAEENSGWRIIPAPILSQQGRHMLAQAVNYKFFEGKHELLWAPESRDISVYGTLLYEPDRTMHMIEVGGEKDYALRYKAPDGEIVSQAEFTKSLLDSGQAVISDSGLVWVYPVMDVKPGPRQGRESTVAELFESVDPTMTTESMITLRLLHLISGDKFTDPNGHKGQREIAKIDRSVDIANEAIYSLNAAGEDEALNSATGISWFNFPATGMIRMFNYGYIQGTGYEEEGIGIRAALSGL